MPLRVSIVTIPGMIDTADYAPLNERMAVDYIERPHITEAALLDIAKASDYLLINYDVIEHISPRFYDQLQGSPLKAISADITGMDWASPEAAQRAHIPLMYLDDYCSDAISEQYLAELLLHSRGIVTEYEDLLRKTSPRRIPSRNLSGRALGVIGIGHIGSKVAAKASCLGMTVYTWNRTPRTVPGAQSLHISEVVSRAEFLAICLKTTNETRQVLQQRVLSQLPRHAVIVNLANPTLIPVEWIREAVTNAEIAGYSVGRTAASEAELGHLDGVRLVSEHSWASEESVSNLRRLWVGHVLDHLNGRPVPIASA